MPADVAHNVPGTTRGKLRTNPEARTDTTSALTMARWASRQTPPLNHPGSVSCTCMRCTAWGTTTWLTGVAYEVAITSDAHGKRASSRVIHAMKHVPRLRPAKLVVEGFPHLVHARARVANLKPAPWCCQQQLPRPLPQRRHSRPRTLVPAEPLAQLEIGCALHRESKRLNMRDTTPAVVQSLSPVQCSRSTQPRSRCIESETPCDICTAQDQWCMPRHPHNRNRQLTKWGRAPWPAPAAPCCSSHWCASTAPCCSG